MMLMWQLVVNILILKIFVEKRRVFLRTYQEMLGVNPSVKDILDETSYKSAKTHSSMDPTVAEILARLKGTKPSAVRGGCCVMVVFYTTSKSRRRTRASIAALEKKAALGVRGVDVEVAEEPAEVVDMEELERQNEKKKASKKGKAKAKRASTNQVGGSVPKKKKGIVISEP
ncbi:hypothetical protein LIER_40231 [Lithospermum erythrorhizon]|uniref:Uncharacterized protein n=1 Tax=Lithospermum erythrorhizon TaxID=34254 RepID=A0AAV3QRC6_LITER